MATACQLIPHFEKIKLNCTWLGRHGKVGYCTDIHARSGNVVYILCKVLTFLCYIYLFCVYSSNLLSCEVYELT
jgi:hypothetical protein